VFSTGAASLAPTGVRPGEALFTVSNDRSLHSVEAGAGGGRWPTEWMPVSMNGPAQGRPAPVAFTSTTIDGADEVIFASSEDGHVYAFDTTTGRELWRSPKLGDTVIAAPSAILTDFGGAQDVILVGSRTPTGDSKFYGIKLQNGAVDWIFDNGGGTTGIGLISSQAQVSYGINRVFFASRAKPGGSSNTLWCLELVAPPTEVQLVWARDLGDIDGSPILRNGVLYVGNNAGQVYAIDPSDGTDEWLSPYTPPAPDGAVKGFVWVDTTATPTRLFYSTTSQVHGLADNLTFASELWPAVSVGSPSPLIVIGDGIWFGSTDDNGSLRRIDTTTGLETDAVLLGDPLVSKSVGAPTYDIQPSLITVGTDEGRVYAVEVSSP
jgi:outer membrane protein assembly factor BamB